MAVNMNPFTNLTNVLNSGVSAVGGVAQSANSVAANVNMQQAIHSGTGNSQAVNAQQEATKKADANQAQLIAMQSEETMRKQTTDVLAAIASGRADSANKEISAIASAAKGIQF